MREPRCFNIAVDSTGEYGGRAGVYLNCGKPEGHGGEHRGQGRFWGDDYKDRISVAYKSKKQKAEYLKNKTVDLECSPKP